MLRLVILACRGHDVPETPPAFALLLDAAKAASEAAGIFRFSSGRLRCIAKFQTIINCQAFVLKSELRMKQMLDCEGTVHVCLGQQEWLQGS